MDDVYYSPEKFDLEPVAEIDYSDGYYQFDYRVVWRHKPTGQLYTARDSGCSCPSPFEDYNALSDLETLSLSVIEDEVLLERQSGDGDNPTEFLQKVRTAWGSRG